MLDAAARRGVHVIVVVARRWAIEPFKHAPRSRFSELLAASVYVLS